MRGAIYGRESQNKKTSVADQLAVGCDWFAAEQHDLVDTYRDGISASRFASKARSDWARLLADIKSGRLELLWLWESSRGDRTLETWAGFLATCREKNVLIRVGSHDRTYNMANWRDWRTLAEDGVDSAVESEKLSARVRRGTQMKALKGRPHGRVTYGYQRHYDEQTRALVSVTEHPVQAQILREAAQLVLRGETTYSIAIGLNARGVPTPRHGSWTVMALRRLLDFPIPDDGSPLSVSLLEARERVRRGEQLSAIVQDYRQRAVPPPPTKWTGPQVKEMLISPAYNGKRTHQGKVVADAIWPALFDDDTHARLVARLCDPARKGRRDCTVKHLLTGIARCGRCGGPMGLLTNRGNGTYQCLDCRRVCRLKSKVDRVVEAAVVSFLERDDCRELLAPPAQDDGVQAALAQVEALTVRLEGFYDQAAAGDLSPAGLARVEQRLLAEIGEAKQRARRITVAPVLELVMGSDAAVKWTNLTRVQQREVIRELMSVQIMPMGRGRRVFDPLSVRITWWHENSHQLAASSTGLRPEAEADAEGPGRRPPVVAATPLIAS